jgi:hypothetical protein
MLRRREKKPEPFPKFCRWCDTRNPDHYPRDCVKLAEQVNRAMELWPSGEQRPIERIDQVLGQLRVYWHMHPDLRLGQIIGNFSANPYNYEDSELLDRLISENAEELMRINGDRDV